MAYLKIDPKKNQALLFILTLFCTAGWAQNSVSLSDRNSINLDMNSIIAGELKTATIADSTQWINYSLEINPSAPLASISVQIGSGTIPDGMEFYMEAGYYHGSSRGKTGRPTGKIRLDNVPKVLLNDIGTGYTGHGKYQGHQLILSVVITDFSLLQSGEFTLFIQYTLQQ